MAAPSSSPLHVSYPLCLLSRLPVSPAREPGRVDAVPGHREGVRRGQPTAGCGMGISSARSSWLISRRCAQGSSRGSSCQKPRVAEARNACRGAAPPCSQNNQGQNRRHEAKSHRERLLRLSCTSDPHGRSGAGQHLASIPAAGTVPASSHTSPEEQLQQPGVQPARTLGVSQVRLTLAKKLENFPTCVLKAWDLAYGHGLRRSRAQAGSCCAVDPLRTQTWRARIWILLGPHVAPVTMGAYNIQQKRGSL